MTVTQQIGLVVGSFCNMLNGTLGPAALVRASSRTRTVKVLCSENASGWQFPLIKQAELSSVCSDW